MTSLLPGSAAREAFPVMDNLLYLDSAHQTPMCLPVRQALIDFCDESCQQGGPKPLWLERAETARARVAGLLNAAPGEIAFTKNTSEGLNIAANALPLGAGDSVLMIEGDHPNNAYAWLNLARGGVPVKFITLDTAVATAATFEPHIVAGTRVIALSHVTFHAGQRHDLESIGALCAQRGLHLVVDAMQSTGVLPIDVKRMNIDVLASGCHKGLLIPQGLGILYVRQGLPGLAPAYLAFAAMAEPPPDLVARADDLRVRADARQFETGNLSLPHLHALIASIDFIERIGTAAIEAHLLMLGDRLIDALDALDIGLVGPRASHERAHIYVLDLLPGDWLPFFAQQGMRVSPERDGVRISFGVFNTVDDVDRLAAALASRLQANLPCH